MAERLAFSKDNVLREFVKIEVIKIPVESTSRPGQQHYVTVSFECSCESFRFRSKCKHAGGILETLVTDGVLRV